MSNARRITGAVARELLAIVAENDAAVAEARRAYFACADRDAAQHSSGTARRLRELDAAHENRGFAVDALEAAAPDLAESLAAVEAERDALRAAVRAHRDAMTAHRDLHTGCPAGWDSSESIAAAFDARDRLKTTREALFALVPE